MTFSLHSFPSAAGTLLLAGVATLSPEAAQAQAPGTPQVDLPQVVITPADTEQALARTIAHTTLIGEADIRRSGFVDVPGLLRSVAGVDFTQAGGLGATSSVTLRGSSPTQVLVLIDGMRVGSATTGTTQLDQIMLDEVDHIEVVRGNVSALYGSAAMGGVIQIFTKAGKGPARPQVSLEAGSHNTRRAAASVRGAAGDTGYSLSLSHVSTDGISALNPAIRTLANPDNDGYRNTSAAASLTQRLDAAHQLGLRAYVSRGEAGYDSAFGTPADINVNQSSTSQLSGFWSAKWTPDWTSTLRLGVNQDRATFTDTTPPGPGFVSRFDTRTTQADLKNELRLTADQVLALGLQSVRQAVDSDTAFDVTSRRTDSLTASYTGDYQWLQTQAALRHDRVTGGSGATTGLLGVAVPVTSALRLTGSVSNAFKLPTFNDLYYPGFGNPNLQPEKARSVEVGAQFEASGLLARAVWFRTRYTDLIASTADTNFIPFNVQSARSQGVDLSARAKLDDWSVRANLTYQEPKNDATGQMLDRRARALGSLDVARDLGALQLGGQLTATGARPDGTHILGAYTLLNLSAAWKPQPEWTLRARMNNVGNVVYTSLYGYNAPGREAFVGVTWQP